MDHKLPFLIVVVSAASLLLMAPIALVQAQSSSDIQEAYDASSNIRKLTAFITACTDKMQTGDMSVVDDCVTVISQFNDAMDQLVSGNAAIFQEMVFG